MKMSEWAMFGLAVMMSVAAVKFDAPRMKSVSAAERASAMRPAFSPYVAGNYANAIEFAQRALPSSPVEALGLIGAASCYQNNALEAADAADRLDRMNPADAAFVRTACEAEGISIRTH